jgi:hypothetical protein
MAKHISIKLAAAFAIVFIGAAQLLAQSTVTGGINGSIKDPQGGLVPNATVTVTNIGTNNAVTAVTNEDGGFRVSNLQPGTYRVETTVSGFAPARAENVIVEVGRSTAVDIDLTLGSATAEVNVTAEAPVINTNDNTNSTNINQTSINELPVNGRRATDFVLLTPASVPDGPFGLISFRGVSGLLNNSTVDGGDNNQSFQSEERGRTRISYVVSQASIREFQVNTSNYSAEYGRSAGAVVNSVTKSGTNEFHGQLFEYYRNNKFGARNPRASRNVLVNGVFTQVGYKPIDVRHQFGGAVGGPIVKDRLFFFFSYDQQKRNFPGLAVFNTPTYLNLSTANRNILIARGLSNTQIDNTLSFINSLTGETPRRGDQRIVLPKIDWHINDANQFSISWNHLRWKSPAGLQTQATNTNARHSFGDDFVNVDTINARLNSTFSSNILNEARFQYSQDHEFALSQEPLPGEPQTATTSQGVRSPQVFLTGGLTFGTTTNFERIRYPFEDRTQFADSVTWTAGRHTIKFGGDFNHVVDDIQNLGSEAGSYSYSNLSDFIVDYVNFATPLPAGTVCATSTRLAGRCYTSNYVQGVGIQGIKFSENEYSFFVQDDFRINPRLTINLGLRYEYQQLPGATIPNTSTAIIPLDGRTLAEATSTLPSDTNNWGPRFGFAYDIFGDGKTSIRGGAGIYYGRILGGHIWNNLLKTGNPAGQGTISAANTATSNCFPIVPTSTTACAPVFPNLLPNSTQALQSATIFFFQRNFQTPQITQYDLILERQLWRNTVVSASYVGSRGSHLPTFTDANLAPTGATRTFSIIGGDANGQTFVLPLYARATTALPSLLKEESSVKSEYNALILQASRRFTDGLQFQASYTLAKSTDTGQNSLITTSIFNQPVDVFNRSYDRGPSTFDVRHKFVASAVWAPTPYKGSTKSIFNYLANGWQIAPIFVFYSGAPYSAIVSGSALNGSNGDNRFTQLPRNAFRLPNIYNLDLRVSKRFRFTERYNLELLAEGFNVFNRTQVFGQNTTLYTSSTTTCVINGVTTPIPAGTTGLCFSPTFGSVTTTDSNKYRERQIQFAVRFEF